MELSGPYAFLLEPIAPDLPCGEDLEYDPQYMELFIRIIPREKKVIGGSMGSERLESEYESVRWSEVERDCLDLLRRTRDVRLFVVLLRCRTQQAGPEGLVQGLLALERHLTLWPEALHPRLETDGEPDSMPRSDALLALTEPQGLLADIRALPVAGSGSLRLDVRDVERSFSMPLPDDALPPEAMRHRLGEIRAASLPEFLLLLEALRLIRRIDTLIHTSLSLGDQGASEDGPDLSSLLQLLGRLELREQESVLESPAPPATVAPESSQLPSPADAADTPLAPSPVREQGIPNRHVAKERIKEIRLWFEEHEPSSPVPVLLRQAEQLIGRRFADLVTSIPPDLLEKWEN